LDDGRWQAELAAPERHSRRDIVRRHILGLFGYCFQSGMIYCPPSAQEIDAPRFARAFALMTPLP
jgi:hypothetical protein